MNDDLIEDLKQFITATIQQATSDLATKDDIDRLDGRMTGLESRMSGMESKMSSLETKTDHLVETVEELKLKVDTIADVNAVDIEDHEKRITRLERGHVTA